MLLKSLSPLQQSGSEIQHTEPEILINDVQNLDISASEGSDSAVSSDSDSPQTQLNSIAEQDEDGPNDLSHLTGSPYVLYTSNNESLLPANKCLAVYKVMLPQDLIVQEPVKALENVNKDGHSVILMIGGGHFAGAIIAHKRPKNGIPTVLESKSFHRYTTRRKQGGAQSASDSARGKANSAGSSLRRYNEAALEKEVREQLQAWSSLIKSADHLFVRATGRINRAVLMNYDKAPILSSDKRIRPIPFTTKRATSMEVRRVWQGLTTANVIDIPTPKPEKKRSREKIASSATQKKEASPPPPLLSPEELDTEEIISLIKKGRTPRVISFYKQHKLDPNFAFEPKNRFNSQPNALFCAAANQQHHLVQMLLTTLQCDPTIENDSGMTAAQLVPADSSTSYAFRIARMLLGEEKWNWEAAGVGSPMTRDEVNQISSLKEETERNERKKEEERLLKESQKRADTSHTQKLNVATKLSQDAQLREMSPELRAKLERERRARAAEARFTNRT